MNLARRDTRQHPSFAPAARAGTSFPVPSAWTERAALVIAAMTVLRGIVAMTTGLSDTEAYYAEWARFPSLSYYDHPPLVAWTTWLATRLLAAGPGVARLGPVLYSAAFDALLYRLAARLFSPRAGFFAVVLVSAVPAFFFTGFLLNPEGLLAPLWILFLLLLLDLRERDESWRPLAMGAVVGVAFLAKYTAIIAVPVAFLYLAGSGRTRRWLRRPAFYFAGLVALGIAAPVLVWNSRNQWPSLHLHLSERMGRPPGEGLVQATWRVGGAQFLLFQPLILLALLSVLAYAVLQSRRDERYRFLATASLPALGFLLTMMLRAGDSEPHWTMVAYMPLLVGAGGLLDESSGPLRRFVHGYFRAALSLSAVVAALYVIHLGSPVLARAMPSYNPNADPISETLGWDRVTAAVRAEAASLGPGTVVAGGHNVLCGHLQAALEDSPAVYCASARRTEFDFIGRRSPPDDLPVVFADSDRYPEDLAAALPHHVCVRAREVEVERSGLHLGRYRIHDCVPRRSGMP
jgi:4-amino-4-deoxy-L-arabinose transferase-like glycosyltransferase